MRASCPTGKCCGPEGPQTPAETGSPRACCACEAALQAAASLRLAGSPCPLSCRRTLSAAGRMLWASWRPRESSSVRTIGTQRERQGGGLLPAGSTWPYRGVVRCSSRRQAACRPAAAPPRSDAALQGMPLSAGRGCGCHVLAGLHPTPPRCAQSPVVFHCYALLRCRREPYHYVRFDDWDDEHYLLIVGQKTAPSAVTSMHVQRTCRQGGC